MHPILKKEWKLQLNRPSFYLIWGIAALYLGIQYFYQMGFFSKISQELYYQGGYSFLENLWFPYFGHVNMLLLFLSPFLVGRVLLEEKKASTYLVLRSMPLSMLKMLAWKYLAGFSFLGSLAFLSVLFPLFSLALLPSIPWGELLPCFLAVIFLTLLYSSVAFFSAAFMSSYLLAGVLCICLELGLWSVGALANASTSSWREWLKKLWVGEHFSQTMAANINLQSCLFFLGLSLLFFYFSYEVIEGGEEP